MEFAEALKNSKYKTLALFNKAVIQQYKGELDSAFMNYRIVRNSIEKNDTIQYLRIINALGNFFQDQGELDSALVYYDLLLLKAREFDIETYKALAFNNLAGTNFMKGFRDYAYKYHDSAYNIRLALNDRKGLAVSLSGKGHTTLDTLYKKVLYLASLKYDSIPYVFTDLANVYGVLGMIDSALYYNTISIKINKRYNRKKWIADSYYSRAQFFSVENSIDSVFKYLKLSRDIYVNINDKIGVSSVDHVYSEVFFKLKKYKKAIDFALIVFQSNPNSNLKKTSLQILAKSYAAIGDFKNAYQYEILLVSLEIDTYKHNNIINEQKFNLETKHQLDSVNLIKQQALMKAQHIIDENEKSKQRIIILFLILGVISVAVFLYAIWGRLNVIKEQKIIIEEQHEKLNQSHKDVTDSINYAKRIQDALMTSTVYMKDILKNSFILFRPKDVVSGDFYWVHKTLNETVYFTVADCTGHGVPGAFMSMIGNSLLNEVIIEGKLEKPSLILDKLRELLIKSLNQDKNKEDSKEGMDMAICKLNLKTLELEYAGAFNPMFHVSKGVLKEYKPDNQPIGVFAGKMTPFTNHTLKLEKGDMIYISSDGFHDQFGGPNGKKFLKKRFCEMIIEASKKPISKQEMILIKTLEDWMGDHQDQIDDICVMGVEV